MRAAGFQHKNWSPCGGAYDKGMLPSCSGKQPRHRYLSATSPSAGAIPIYIGAPDVNRVIPVPEAIIKVEDFARCGSVGWNSGRQVGLNPAGCSLPRPMLPCQVVCCEQQCRQPAVCCTLCSVEDLVEYIKKVAEDETLWEKHMGWKKLPQSKWSKVCVCVGGGLKRSQRQHSMA